MDSFQSNNKGGYKLRLFRSSGADVPKVEPVASSDEVLSEWIYIGLSCQTGEPLYVERSDSGVMKWE